MFEWLCHYLIDVVIDLTWNDVLAGIGQAVFRAGGCGRFSTA
jgi:hypothetical protein